MYLRIDVSEVKALARDIREHAAITRGRAEEIVAVAGTRTVAIAQQLAPVDTGALRNSIGVDVSGLAFEAGPTVDYGDFVEQGTAPHLIPNAFGWGITVHHPGTPAEPFLGPAFDRVEPVAFEAFASLASGILD
jgi:hypothetical protein